MSLLSPIIVNYKTPELVLQCVASILAMGVAEPENIVVVDNLSPDDSVSRLRAGLPDGVKLVASERNGGYSAGVNVGAALAQTPLLLVLNPDTRFEDRSYLRAVDALTHDASVGLVGLDLIYPDGKRQYSARRFYSVLDIVARRTPLGRLWPLRARIRKHLMLDAWQGDSGFEADWVMGTGFIVRRDVFESIGRMDETFFMYMEDVDLCARIWAAGKRVMCVPGARLVHDHQRSSAAGAWSRAGRMHLTSLRTYAAKHGLPWVVPPVAERRGQRDAAAPQSPCAPLKAGGQGRGNPRA